MGTAIDAAIQSIAQYGLIAILVIVTSGFLWALVIPRITHQEIVALWRERYEDVVRDNDRLWSIATQSSAQATRATGLAENAIEPRAPARSRRSGAD